MDVELILTDIVRLIAPFCLDGEWRESMGEFGLVKCRESMQNSRVMSCTDAANLTRPYQDMLVPGCSTAYLARVKKWRPSQALYVYLHVHDDIMRAITPVTSVTCSSSSSCCSSLQVYWQTFSTGKCEAFCRFVLELLWYICLVHGHATLKGQRVTSYGMALCEVDAVNFRPVLRVYKWTDAGDPLDTDTISHPLLHKVVYLATDASLFFLDLASAQYRLGNVVGSDVMWRDDGDHDLSSLPFVLAPVPTSSSTSFPYRVVHKEHEYDAQERQLQLSFAKQHERLVYDIVRYLTRHVLMRLATIRQWKIVKLPPYERLMYFQSAQKRHEWYDGAKQSRTCCTHDHPCQ